MPVKLDLTSQILSWRHPGHPAGVQWIFKSVDWSESVSSHCEHDFSNKNKLQQVLMPCDGYMTT